MPTAPAQRLVLDSQVAVHARVSVYTAIVIIFLNIVPCLILAAGNPKVAELDQRSMDALAALPPSRALMALDR
jgi:hypothetical protein